MTALSDLLNELNRENWSTRQIEDRTERLGMKVSNGAVGRYLKGTHPAKPSPRVLKALAAVFRVDENRLREAANQAPTLDRFELPAEADVLDPDERQAVVNLVRVMARNRKAGEQGERDTSPMNQAGVRPADEIKARRQLVDEWSFGHPPRGDYGLIADRGPSEGKRQASEADKRGEESQDPEDRQ